MGEIADMMFDSMLFDDILAPVYVRNFRARLWRTRDGQLIHISEMSDAHLCYSIARIRRRRWREKWFPVLMGELLRRIAS